MQKGGKMKKNIFIIISILILLCYLYNIETQKKISEILFYNSLQDLKSSDIEYIELYEELYDDTFVHVNSESKPYFYSRDHSFISAILSGLKDANKYVPQHPSFSSTR